MKFQKLELRIQPSKFGEDVSEMITEITVDGMRHSARVSFQNNYFDSGFDNIMSETKKLIYNSAMNIPHHHP